MALNSTQATVTNHGDQDVTLGGVLFAVGDNAVDLLVLRTLMEGGFLDRTARAMFKLTVDLSGVLAYPDADFGLQIEAPGEIV